MPWEDVGHCGTASTYARESMVAELDHGIAYVRLICVKPPNGCRLRLM